MHCLGIISKEESKVCVTLCVSHIQTLHLGKGLKQLQTICGVEWD